MPPPDDPLLSLADIEAEVRRLAAVIDAPAGLLPLFGADGARRELDERIEVDAEGYHLVMLERNQGRGRSTTRVLDDLMEAVFGPVTFQMAVEHELANRVPMRDGRRLIFARHEELLSRISPVWAERQARRHAEILRRYPFDDGVDLRIRIGRELIAQGVESEKAWERAETLIPRPTPQEPG